SLSRWLHLQDRRQPRRRDEYNTGGRRAPSRRYVALRSGRVSPRVPRGILLPKVLRCVRCLALRAKCLTPNSMRWSPAAFYMHTPRATARRLAQRVVSGLFEEPALWERVRPMAGRRRWLRFCIRRLIAAWKGSVRPPASWVVEFLLADERFRESWFTL